MIASNAGNEMMTSNPSRNLSAPISPTNKYSDNQLLIVIYSLGGAAAVLAVSTFFLCCYLYRTRSRRRNYPLSLSIRSQNRASFVPSSIPSDGVNGVVHPSRPSAEKETKNYNFNDIQESNGVDNTCLDKASGLSAPKSGFDNPVWKKYSVDSAAIFHERSNEARRSSSPNSVTLPGLPAVLIMDESASDDRRRLVPNDSLSLEIDRNERWLRSCLETQRRMFEDGEIWPETAANSSKNGEGSSSKEGGEDANAVEMTDAVDFGPKARLVHLPTRRKLHRRLAKTIAKDRVLENSVNFTGELDSPSSPASPIPHSNNTHFLTVNGGKRKFERGSDDLELIFKERTQL